MTTTLDTLLDQLKLITQLIEDRIDALTVAGKQVVTPSGLSDIDVRLGIIQAGEFRTGNGVQPGHGFSGVRIGYPPFTYEGEEWNVVGVDNDVLQVGIRASDGKLIAGGGNIQLSSNGIAILQDAGGQAFLSFYDSTGVTEKFAFKMTNDDMQFQSLIAGGGVQWMIKLTDTTTPYINWEEDPGEANTALMEINAGNTATFVSIGNDILMSANRDGSETVFNDRSNDINFRIESATDSLAFNLDAAAEAVSFFGSLGATTTTFTVDGSEKRIEVGADHYFAIRGASNPNTYINEANQDMDTYIRTVNNDYSFVMDAGLDKSTSFLWDGWGFRTETWTRTGNHTFTLSGDLTATYRKGTKVRYKDGGSFEYGVIGASSHSGGTTTITLITTSDYAMAATTITDTSISYLDNPEGFPTLFNYTPTPGNMTLNNGTVTGVWTTRGTMIAGQISFTFGSTTSLSPGDIYFSFPVTLTNMLVANVVIGDVGVNGYFGYPDTNLTDMFLRVLNTSGTYGVYSPITGTVPMSWNSGDFAIGKYIGLF